METCLILRGWKITSAGKVAFISFKIKRSISNGTPSNKFRALMNWSSITWKEQPCSSFSGECGWLWTACILISQLSQHQSWSNLATWCDSEGFANTPGERIQPISLMVWNIQWISLLLRFNISLSVLIRKMKLYQACKAPFLSTKGVAFPQLFFTCIKASGCCIKPLRRILLEQLENSCS